MNTFDASVIGRGAVGSVAALALARAGRQVALVGPKPARPVKVAAASSLSATASGPAGEHAWDQRVFALSPASRTLLTELGVWQLMDPARVAPVHDMRVFNATTRRGAIGRSEVHLDAYKGRVEALAWIVENRNLQAAVDQAIAGASHTIKLTRVDAEVDELTLPASPQDYLTAATLGLAGGGRLSSHLVVAADGTGSRLRDLADIDYVKRDLGHTAVVANFEASQPHRDSAWQWFGHWGVVALLPLPSEDLEQGRSRVSLVWSAPPDQAIRALGDEEGRDTWLATEVRTMTGDRLGALRLITPPAGFALRTVHCRQVVKPGFVLIGDAAHAIHPMAGQGMNLGFGDVRALIDNLSGPRPDWLALRRYERSRRESVAAMQFALDGLFRAFSDLPAPLVGLRDLGWEMVARSTWLKRRMIDHAVS